MHFQHIEILFERRKSISYVYQLLLRNTELTFKDSISFQKTVIESIENLLKNSTTKIATSKNSQIEFENMLEVQEQLKEMMKKHWEHWFDEPIPALNNKTPRQAAKTKKGRELLEILLLEYESHDSDRNDNLLKADIPYLKEKLGLKEELI